MVKGLETIRIDQKEITGMHVDLFSTGSIDISVFGVSGKRLKEIALLTSKKIEEYGGDKWVKFYKAKDKSQLTIFAE